MINFIPKAFAAEETTCPICIARGKMEAALLLEREAMAALAEALNTSENPDRALSAELWTINELFADSLANYRVAFAVNLGIWFSAERFGRAKKVPDLLLAYEEYRAQAVDAFTKFANVTTEFLRRLEASEFAAHAQTTVESLAKAHADLAEVIPSFWKEVDAWTNQRREEAFSVV